MLKYAFHTFVQEANLASLLQNVPLLKPTFP